MRKFEEDFYESWEIQETWGDLTILVNFHWEWYYLELEPWLNTGATIHEHFYKRLVVNVPHIERKYTIDTRAYIHSKNVSSPIYLLPCLILAHYWDFPSNLFTFERFIIFSFLLFFSNIREISLANSFDSTREGCINLHVL